MNRITPENITELKENEIFVFGSNLAGRHGKGAAKTALKWGAEYGRGWGEQGQTFAIPTKDENIQTLPLHEIEQWVSAFYDYAAGWPELTFLVTKIGCGYAGYTPAQIAPMFDDCIFSKNIHLPLEFWDILNKFYI